MVGYIYLACILGMIMLIYEGITTSISYAPEKIKHITVMALILVVLRYISLLLLYLNQRPLYMYLLKPIMFLEIVYLPIIGFICIYIFSRNDKIKLNYFYFISTIFLVIYLFIAVKAPIKTTLSELYGYTIILEKDYNMYLILCIINTIYFVMGIRACRYKYSNKLGSLLILISSLLTLTSVLLTVVNAKFFGAKLVGEILWVITMVYGLEKFRQNYKKGVFSK
ncbi:hypothetical protein [Clostridium sp. UBA6640]|uniref:hypothetical protein n=1 Tax=Clostridium sp. UBA6640 TaxID=1946370 RepID=UPI0025BBE1E7|nr:hypothetical protein [Clostridium sp. UBA6640]